MWQGDVWERGPGAVVRQWAAFFFDGHLQVRLVGNESGHAGKRMRSVPHSQIAEILFAFNVFLLPMKSALQRERRMRKEYMSECTL